MRTLLREGQYWTSQSEIIILCLRLHLLSHSRYRSPRLRQYRTGPSEYKGRYLHANGAYQHQAEVLTLCVPVSYTHLRAHETEADL
eukprot:886094-Rhodomonas_salina.1